MRSKQYRLSMIFLILFTLVIQQPQVLRARPKSHTIASFGVNTPQAISLTITGQWVDSNRVAHPMRNIPADIFVVNTTTPIKSVTLGMDGRITTTLPGSGNRSIFVRFYAKGAKFEVVDDKGKVHIAESSVVTLNDTMTTAQIDFITPNPNTKKNDQAFGIADGMVTAIGYVTSKGSLANIAKG